MNAIQAIAFSSLTGPVIWYGLYRAVLWGLS